MRKRTVGAIGIAVAAIMTAGGLTPATADDLVTLNGYRAPGTPAQYNKVQVLKQGPAAAGHVLVLVPGTSAGAANFRPMARALLQRLDGDWQVWSIERRENLLEDHSVLKRYRAGQATSEQLVDYYLGWLTNSGLTPRFQPKTTDETTFARDWGLKVAVKDIRRVVTKASAGGRTVVLGGHSLGGRITTAYATWNFAGKPGVRDLSGLVFIDGGGSSRELPTAAEARADLAELDAGSPWSDLLGLGLPWVTGIFNVLGSTTAVTEPDRPSALQPFPLVPDALKAPVPATNLGQYGYSVDNDTSPQFLALVHSHIGNLATSGEPRGWQDGELGSARRAAQVFAEYDGYDGTSWYHPRRLSLDGSSVNNGIANPAQKVLGVRSVFGKRIDVPLFSFDAALGGGRVADSTRALAAQSGLPRRAVTTIDRSSTFAHIDPLSAASDRNTFVMRLAPWLKRIAAVSDPDQKPVRGRG